jgi:predicted nucleic acid-binding protein
LIFDSNIVLALLDESVGSMMLNFVERHRADCTTYINEIIFAEISPRFVNADLVMEICEVYGLEIATLTLVECHRAGQAFAEYRRRGGQRATILPDFLIGAQAEIRGWPLVTRDRKGFASYFPDLQIIDPFEGSA